MLEALSLLIVLAGAAPWCSTPGGTCGSATGLGSGWGPATERRRQAPAPIARPFLRRHRLLPWLAGAAAGVLVHFVLGWSTPFAVAVG